MDCVALAGLTVLSLVSLDGPNGRNAPSMSPVGASLSAHTPRADLRYPRHYSSRQPLGRRALNVTCGVSTYPT